VLARWKACSRQAHGLQRVQRAGPFLQREAIERMARHSGSSASQAGEHIGQHRQAAHQVELLEDDAHLPALRADVGGQVARLPAAVGRTHGRHRPASSVSSPHSARSSVDLPEPEAPISATCARPRH
jgi:hypothetical protein